jgi:hypothetical protein
MPAKTTHTLKVRRIDLLEQLEERYAWMTKEKQKYEAEDAKYRLACDKYYKDVAKWEACIPDALEKALKKAEPTWSERMYGRDTTYTVSARVDMDLKDLEAILGPYPVKPEGVEPPSFLSKRYGTYREGQLPSVYHSVYQAIQLLHMSDDETVSASMYQLALEAL